MKAIKLFSLVLAFCAVTFAGYQTYSLLTASELDGLIASNVEALADDVAVGHVDQSCVWAPEQNCTIGTVTAEGAYTTTWSNHTYR